MAPLLDVRNLSVRFPQSRLARATSHTEAEPTGAVTAVRDLTFSIAPGEVLGLVGESGSGKSVTSLAIMGLLPPGATISGSIAFQNSEARSAELTALPADELRRLRGSRIAMIFQEPMTALNPVMRVGDQIAEAFLAHPPKPLFRELSVPVADTTPAKREPEGEPGFWRKSRKSLNFLEHLAGTGNLRDLARTTQKHNAWSVAINALREVGIPEPERRARSYPHQLSGGMRQRVMIAMAIVNRPQLLIADEPTTALDVTIQQQILDLLNELRQKFSLAMLFISHDLAVVSHVADRVAVMYAGSLVELAPKAAIFAAPAHPYTRGLLRAIPTLSTNRGTPLTTIEGSVPAITALLPGCPFEPRCASRISACATEVPALVEVGRGHFARCPVVSRL